MKYADKAYPYRFGPWGLEPNQLPSAELLRRASLNRKRDPYTASMRVPNEDEAFLASLIAFEPQVCERLLELKKGDTLSISGRAKLTAWVDRKGEQCRGISVVTTQIATSRPTPRKRAPKRDDSEHDATGAFLAEAGDLSEVGRPRKHKGFDAMVTP